MALQDFAELTKAIPGALGSLFSMLWIKDTLLRMVVMFFGGIAFSFYGSPYASKVSGLDSGIIGFLLGLFGMSLVASLFVGWQKLDMSIIMRDAIRQVLRLPPKEQ